MAVVSHNIEVLSPTKITATSRQIFAEDRAIIGVILSIVVLAVIILVWRIFWFRRYTLSEQRQRQDAILLAQARRAAARRALEENDEQAQAFAEQAIEEFDAASVQTESLCAVCLEILDVKQGDVLAAPCMHVLHEKCWKGWLAKDLKRACPICRSNVIIEHQPTSEKSQSVSNNNNNNENNNNESVQQPERAMLDNPSSRRIGLRLQERSRHLSLLSNRNRNRNNSGTNNNNNENIGDDYDYNQSRHLSLILFDGTDDNLDNISFSNGMLSLMRVTHGPSSNSRHDVTHRRQRLLTASANINLLGTIDPNNMNNEQENDINEIQRQLNGNNNQAQQEQQ